MVYEHNMVGSPARFSFWISESILVGSARLTDSNGSTRNAGRGGHGATFGRALAEEVLKVDAGLDDLLGVLAVFLDVDGLVIGSLGARYDRIVGSLFGVLIDCVEILIVIVIDFLNIFRDAIIFIILFSVIFFIIFGSLLDSTFVKRTGATLRRSEWGANLLQKKVEARW
jgi:hypothetical protein